MTRYEFKVIPAPTKGVKAPGRKSPDDRHANAVEQLLNAQAAEGWDYLRSDMLPSDERQGLTSTQTVYRTVLVFRRPVTDAAEEVIADAQAVAVATADPDPSAETAPADADAEAPAPDAPDTPETTPRKPD